jgi:hypothetical protein
MKLDSQGRIYWDSLTPKQKWEWDWLCIDPTKPMKVLPMKVCADHLEENCRICKLNKIKNRCIT